MSHLRALAATAVVSLSLASTPGCWGGPDEAGAPAAVDTPQRVILVTLDTVRAESMSAYGYHKPTSPHTAALATQGTLYTEAFSNAPWTLPAHASLFTGLLPTEHRAHKFKLDPDHTDMLRVPLLAEQLTLAEELSSRGWATGGFAANDGYLLPHWGLHQGFEHYEVDQVRGTELVDRALAWLDEHEGEPALAFINVMEAHTPYVCDLSTGLGPCEWKHSKRRYKRLAEAPLLDGIEPHREELARFAADYHRGVASADLAVGHLVAGLKARGWFDDALIVITSDHGESFGEHGVVGHGKDVWDPLIRVPLVVKAPGQQQPARNEETISLLHIPGLIYTALGWPVPEAFARHWPPTGAISEAHFISGKELKRSWGKPFDNIRHASISGQHKLIADSLGGHRLFDLAEDRAELVDLAADNPEVITELAQPLPGFDVGPIPEIPKTKLPTRRELEALEALGYVE